MAYLYSSQCPKTGKIWQLPRTEAAERSAIAFMEELAELDQLTQSPTLTGNLYGVLLARTTAGESVVLKGCSGWVPQQNQSVGWVRPLPVQAQMALAERKTLATLDQLKAALIALEKLPIRAVYKQKYQQYAAQLDRLAGRHRERKRARDRARTDYAKNLQGEALTHALKALTRESQQESTERRLLKQTRDQALAPLAAEIDQADRQIQSLKQRYATLSQAWQQQMKVAYFAERASVAGGAQPGECRKNICEEACYQRAALKLVHHAITHQLIPLSLAEFWWGAPQGDYVSGQFYGASDDECRDLMGLAIAERPSLSTELAVPLSILYQDEFLMVVDKPAGLLSVPGRRYHLQDSVLSRLRYQLFDYQQPGHQQPDHQQPDHQRPGYSSSSQPFLQPVHRLDQATSGLLVVATSAEAHGVLSQQFAQRQVRKTYEALLSRPIDDVSGVIDLPIRSDPDNRPRQLVNFQRGKTSRTDYSVLQLGEHPRVEFVPHTGRTHQLRVHAAHAKGLNSPILGDVLYGSLAPSKRLHLHANVLEFVHPVTGKPLRLKSTVPF